MCDMRCTSIQNSAYPDIVLKFQFTWICQDFLFVSQKSSTKSFCDFKHVCSFCLPFIPEMILILDLLPTTIYFAKLSFDHSLKQTIHTTYNVDCQNIHKLNGSLLLRHVNQNSICCHSHASFSMDVHIRVLVEASNQHKIHIDEIVETFYQDQMTF